MYSHIYSLCTGNYYSNNAIDDYQVDDRKTRRESKSTRPW